MNISDETLKLIADSIDRDEIDIEAYEVKIIVAINAPILGQDDRRVELELEIFQDDVDILGALEYSLRRREYDVLDLAGSDYTDKELEEIALLLKLAA
jgi:hypothetical protein